MTHGIAIARYRRFATAVVFALVLVGRGGKAYGDPPELERRLRAIPVDAALRAKVRKAVDAAVSFLVRKQQPDGSFVEHGGVTTVTPLGVTLRAALALRHAGTAVGDSAFAKADTFLFEAGEARIAAIAGVVEDAAFASMVVAGSPARAELATRLSNVLVRAQDLESGWWPSVRGGPPSLETSGYAVLGLLAARGAGIEVPKDVWARHARGLVAAQTTKYDAWPIRYSARGGRGETVGTLLGLGGLAAAEGALGAGGDPLPDLRKGIAAAVKRAKVALNRDGGRTLSDPLGHFEVLGDDEGIVMPQGTPPFEVSGVQGGRRDPQSPGTGSYSRLLFVEYACTLADVEFLDALLHGKSLTRRTKDKVTRVPCYATAARWLLGVQQADGGFAAEADRPKESASESDTALAVLVLTRAVSVFHPTKPAPLDAKPRAK